jgi:hypothetical protein
MDPTKLAAIEKLGEVVPPLLYGVAYLSSIRPQVMRKHGKKPRPNLSSDVLKDIIAAAQEEVPQPLHCSTIEPCTPVNMHKGIR